MNALLLAAGRGERLRPMTERTPKALVEVAGSTLIEHHLRRLAAAGVRRVVINLGWLGEQIEEHLGSGRRYGLAIVYSPEYDDILDTGGGILRALPLLGDAPFWAINADICCDLPLPAPSLADDELGRLVLVPTPDYREQGDFALVDGTVRRDATRPLTFSGIACYRPALFAGCAPGRFSLAPLLFAAAARGELAGTLYTGRWADAGTADRLAALRAELGG